MSEQAQPQTEELKKQGDPLDKIEESVGAVSRKEQDQTETGQQEKENK